MMKTVQLLILSLLLATGRTVSAEAVFNSLDSPFAGGFWPDDPAQLVAQPFVLGNNDAVTSATVGMGGNGAPTGTIYLEIWNDSGSGTPGQSMGLLGSIDVSTVNTSGGGGDHTVNSPVSGLTPNEVHYLVMSYEDIFMDNGNHAIWGGTERTSQLAAANNGAAEGMVTGVGTQDWYTMQAYPGGPPFPVYHFASIEAVPEPSATALLLAGVLLPRRYRKKRAQNPASTEI